MQSLLQRASTSWTADAPAEGNCTFISDAANGREQRNAEDSGLLAGTFLSISCLSWQRSASRTGFLPIQERDASNIITREYTWGKNLGGGIGGLLNLRQGGADYSYLYDGKGNVSALIDSTQAVVASYAYDPFGQLMSKSGNLVQPYTFSTKEAQSGTGQYYYGYRFYDSCSGKWTTRDPLGERADLNLYRMIQNNTVNLIDPLGLWTLAIGGSASGGGGAGASGSVMVVVDGHGNIGITESGGAGGYGGVSASGGMSIQITNADTIYDLEGVSAQTGGSVGEGISVGAELVTGTGYMGININLGFGGGLTPVEMHSFVEYAGVQGRNIKDIIDFIKNLLAKRKSSCRKTK